MASYRYWLRHITTDNETVVPIPAGDIGTLGRHIIGDARAIRLKMEARLTRFGGIRTVAPLDARRDLMWGYSSAGRAQHWQC